MIISLIFAIITIFGQSYKKTNSWDLVFQDLIGNTILIIIYTITFYFIIKGLKKIFPKIANKESKENKINTTIFEKYPYIIPFLIILISWLPIIIIKYPGTPGWDFYYFINNYYKFDEWLTQHFPLLYVFLCVYFVKFGVLINNLSLGLFLLTLLHGITMLASFALTFVYLKKWNINYKYRWFLLLFYCLNPIFSNYFTTIYHDILYSSFMLIYVLILTDLCIEKNISKKKMIILSILSILICWTRKNGLYIILPIDIIIFFKYIIKNKNRIFNIATIVTPIILFALSEYIFSIYYFPTSILEAVSVPIQTIARYSRDYHDDISIEEKQDIDGFINYDLAGELYNPTLVDPARNNAGNYFSTNEQKINFFKTWFKLFFRHPTVYIQAFINNTYNLYYPFENATYIFTKVKDDEKYETIFTYNEPENLKIYKEKLRDAINKFEEIPIICYLDDPGIYVWILILLAISVIKKKEEIIPLIPLLMTFLFCIIGPTIKMNTRYTFPILFSIFPIVAFYSYKYKNNT